MKIARHVALILPLVAVSFGQVYAQSTEERLEAARQTFAKVDKDKAYTEDLTSASHNILPVGIHRVVNNTAVTIAVDKATFHRDYTELSVFAKVELPQKSEDKTPTVLFFGARGIKLSNDGSIIGDASLVLLQDVTIPFNGGKMSLTLKGDYDSKTGNSRSKSYLSIDCEGFKELGLDVELSFPDTLLEKVDPASGKVMTGDKRVTGHFQTVVEDWNNLLVDVTLPSFQICGLDGFVFDLQNVTLDISDSHNGDAVRFPAGYQQRYGIPDAVTLWRGVYARDITVTLPEQFGSDDKRASFSAHDMLIDDNGVTGLFVAENILPFEVGDAGGWNFSVNTLKVELEASNLLMGGFEGDIGLPVGEKGTKLAYDAQIRQNNEYLMVVKPVDSLDFSFLCARATILPNSWIKMEVKDRKFRPEAMLHGVMSIETGKDTDKKEVAAKIPHLEFRGLHITTEAPYLTVDYLGYKGTVSLGAAKAFQISLGNIALKAPGGGRIELASDVGVTLASDMFSGKTRLALLASMRDVEGRRRWHFDGARLDMIELHANIAKVVTLDGKLEWKREDPIYGDGFYGDLNIGITKIGLNVAMRGCFGTVEGYKYWFVDGSVKLPPPGIPVMGPFKISGFAGGVSQRMRGEGSAQGNPATSGKEGKSMLMAAHYVPDKNMGLGLKASVMFGIGEAVSGEACFDISFCSAGGVSNMGFYGFAAYAGPKMASGDLSKKYGNILNRVNSSGLKPSLLTKLKQDEPNKAAEKLNPIPDTLSVAIKGTVGIKYDFENNSFHASTEIYVTTPGGFLTGDGKNGRAGHGVFHIDPQEWYMHLGAPDDRIGLRLNVGNLLSIRTGAYMMAGSRIPAMPLPPRQVADIIGGDLGSLSMGRNLEELSTGKGFAFGADFGVKTGDITFLILYANFAAGMGFDFMLKDYGQLQCEETGRQVGMRGWYAKGQAYTYLQGELGVKVNLWFLKTKFPIIKGGAAALLQAALPNPSYFRGHLGVKFNLLGGLVKGNMRFKFNIGDECTPVIPGSSPLQMAMISDIAPTTGDTDVSVFTTPQATFTSAVGSQFDADDGNGTNAYRIKLKSFTVKSNDGKSVDGMLKWNTEKTSVSFSSKEVLPENTLLTARVEVGFEKLTGSGWSTVVTSGKEAIESKECTFTTGGAPDYIPLENVEYCYPVAEQRYFLTGESSKGFVQLKAGQNYLFERGFGYKLLFTDGTGSVTSTDFHYNEGAGRIEFTMPRLQTQQRYAVKLVYTPTTDGGSTEAISMGGEMQSDGGLLSSDDNAADNIETSKRGAVAEVDASGQKSILDYGFATSRHGTFREKLASIGTEGNGIVEDAGGSYRFLYDVYADEAFDEAEVVGSELTARQPLIRPEASLTEPFFTQTVTPLVYSGYPFGGIRLRNRVDEDMGVPPVRSVFVYGKYLNLLAGGVPPKRFIFPFSYEAGIVAEHDYRDLVSQVAGNRERVSREVYNRFVRGGLPFIKYGKYKTLMRYVLPDGTVTSSQDFYFNNFLKFNE